VLEEAEAEAEELSQELGEVWTDGLPAYKEMEYEHRQVVHDETYVSSAGVHVNQVECLWSVLLPWLETFRGLSREGLDKAVRRFGFMRSLTLAQAPVRWLIDAVSINPFRKIGLERRFSHPLGEPFEPIHLLRNPRPSIAVSLRHFGHRRVIFLHVVDHRHQPLSRSFFIDLRQYTAEVVYSYPLKLGLDACSSLIPS
jgi:hypothetical protein